MKNQPEIIEVNFKGYDLEVTGIYTRGEDAVLFPVDNAYPGSSPKFDIKKIRLAGAEGDVVPADVKEEELEVYILEKEFNEFIL